MVVNAVVEQKAVGKESSGIVGCGDAELEHVEDDPAEQVDVQLREAPPCYVLPRSCIERGERVA